MASPVVAKTKVVYCCPKLLQCYNFLHGYSRQTMKKFLPKCSPDCSGCATASCCCLHLFLQTTVETEIVLKCQHFTHWPTQTDQPIFPPKLINILTLGQGPSAYSFDASGNPITSVIDEMRWRRRSTLTYF